MADVGQRAGVTARTVSNVLSGNASVRPETRDAVLRAVEELGYRLNVSARGLRTGRTGFITLAIPDLGIDYFAELAQAVMDAADRMGWSVVIQQTGGKRERELEILSGTRRQLSDGLLFHPHALDAADEKYLAPDQPLVLLGERLFTKGVDHVTMANVQASAAATAYLVRTGRMRIAAIGANPAGGRISTAALRFEGYQQALRDAGLPFDDSMVAPAVEWHRRIGASAMVRLLSSSPDIDAVFCMNDTLALGALHALAEQGRSVPDDVAVVGFDNVTGAAFSSPPLTTIDPGSQQIATTAVELLNNRMNSSAFSAPAEVVADYSLVLRRSA